MPDGTSTCATPTLARRGVQRAFNTNRRILTCCKIRPLREALSSRLIRWQGSRCIVCDFALMGASNTAPFTKRVSAEVGRLKSKAFRARNGRPLPGTVPKHKQTNLHCEIGARFVAARQARRSFRRSLKTCSPTDCRPSASNRSRHFGALLVQLTELVFFRRQHRLGQIGALSLSCVRRVAQPDPRS